MANLKFADWVQIGFLKPNLGIIASKPNENNEYYIYNLDNNKYELFSRSSLYPVIYKEIIGRKLANEVKIKSFEESSKIFNYRKIKSKLVNQNFPFKIELNFKCKIDGNHRDTVIITTPEGKKLRFVESDCEYLFTQPKIVLQVHKPNLNIRVGDFVKLVNSKKLPIPKNTICKVINLISRKHKYADKKTGKLINNTNIVYLEYNGKHYPTLIKNVKKVIYDTNSKQTMPF